MVEFPAKASAIYVKHFIFSGVCRNLILLGVKKYNSSRSLTLADFNKNMICLERLLICKQVSSTNIWMKHHGYLPKTKVVVQKPKLIFKEYIKSRYSILSLLLMFSCGASNICLSWLIIFKP